MNIAILAVSSLSLVVSVGTFLVMTKTAHELKKAKAEVDTVKAKVNHNATVLKTALGAMEL